MSGFSVAGFLHKIVPKKNRIDSEYGDWTAAMELKFPLLCSISSVAFGENSGICGSGLLTLWLVIIKSFINNRIYYIGTIFLWGGR